MTIIEKAYEVYPRKMRIVDNEIEDDNFTPRFIYIAAASWVRDELWEWAEEWLKSAEKFGYTRSQIILVEELINKLNNL